MTATSAGSSSCLAAKGLDISLAALQRQDPYINNIMDVASQVALYTYNNRANEWEKTEVEGTLFIYTRLASPRHGFTIMNRLSMENLTEPITKDLDFQLQDPFLLYRNARLVIHGIWFYDKEDCQRIARRMKLKPAGTTFALTKTRQELGSQDTVGGKSLWVHQSKDGDAIKIHQEQALAQSQGGWLSPGGGGAGNEAKGVDIIQMLTKARSEYDKEKSTSEPKEFGGSSVLYGNPNLIKPIPVKPNTQETEGAETKSLSLATLFGSQPKHHSPKLDPISPSAVHGMVSSTGKLTRPPVARTLVYDDTLGSGRSENSKEGTTSISGCSDTGVRAIFGGQNVGEDSGAVVGGVLVSPAAQQQNPTQHCPAIQKLMQGQRGVGGVLQTVSESPENRLCDNGMPLEHHHHHHHLYHHQQQQHQHHHHHHHQQQIQHDPIRRLLQTQPPPPSSAPPPCCSVPSQLVMVDSVSCSHPQQTQLLMFNLPQREAQNNSQLASATQGTGVSSQMPGVVSPHELLQKLQLVQQEQSLASHDSSPRPCPGLAPRFLGPTQSEVTGSVPKQTAPTAGQKAALQFQVISPQRIPATVAPTMLLSPSVFTKTKPGAGLSGVQELGHVSSNLPRAPLKEEVRVLSRSQLQATLLHLIQTDSSFLNTIYEAYISRFANDSCSKY